MTYEDEIKEMMGLSEESTTGSEPQAEEEYNDDLQQFEGEEGEASAVSATEEGQEEVAPAEEAGGEEAEDTLDKRYARLLEEHNKLSGLLLQHGISASGTQPSTSQPTVAPAAPVVQQQVALKPIEIDDRLIEKALIEDDPAAMKQVLTGVLQHVQQMQHSIREQVLVDLPSLAQNVARQEFALMSAVREFYEQNSDLKPYAQIVGAITNEIVAKDPQLSLEEAFKRVETETRRRLGLKKQIQRVETANTRQTPAFGKSTSSRKPGPPALQGLKGEIAAMQNAKW